MRGRHLRSVPVALASAGMLVLAACGDTTRDEGAPAAPTSGDEVTLIADDVAFDRTEIEVTAGALVALTFENRDEGVPHNVHIEGADGGDVTTEIESGPVTQRTEVSFTRAGSYSFFCDVHPDTMRGTIMVT